MVLNRGMLDVGSRKVTLITLWNLGLSGAGRAVGSREASAASLPRAVKETKGWMQDV